MSLLALGQQQPTFLSIFKFAVPLCSTPSEIINRVETLVSRAETLIQKKSCGTAYNKNGKQIDLIKSAKK